MKPMIDDLQYSFDVDCIYVYYLCLLCIQQLSVFTRNFVNEGAEMLSQSGQ